MKEAQKSVVEEFVEGDPFYQHEVASFEIIEFIPTKYDAGFTRFVE